MSHPTKIGEIIHDCEIGRNLVIGEIKIGSCMQKKRDHSQNEHHHFHCHLNIM